MPWAPSSLSCKILGHENGLEACFFDVLTRWLSAAPPLTTYLAIMDVDKLWEVRDPDYTDDALVRCNSYEHNISSGVRLHINFKGLHFLIIDRAATVRDLHQLSQVSDGMALHVRLDEFIHYRSSPDLSSSHLCFTTRSYLFIFVRSGPRLCQWLWWYFEKSSISHSDLNGNCFSNHRMCRCWTRCKWASTVE